MPRRVTEKISESASLIRLCQKRWEHYLARVSKKRLKDVFEHLDKMKDSASKKVAQERTRCLRAARREAKRLGMMVK